MFPPFLMAWKYTYAVLLLGVLLSCKSRLVPFRSLTISNKDALIELGTDT